jgi:hypothetical protein
MLTDQELERRIRHVAGLLEAPVPSQRQLELILERRRRGERVIMSGPAAGRGRMTIRWIARVSAVAVAAALLLFFIAPRLATRPSGTVGTRTLAAPSVFAAEPLAAQVSGSPSFATMEAAKGLRLRPGRWTYSAEPDAATHPGDTLFVYSVEPSEYAGAPAWLLLAGKQVKDHPPFFTDSTWVTRNGLELLGYHAPAVEEQWQPLPALVLAVLQAADLSADSAISVPITRPSDDSVAVRFWVNLRIHGEEVIEVPAGRFTCWKVSLHRGRGRFNPALGFFFWISKSERWPVRQGMAKLDDLSFGKMNLQLLRSEAMK